MKRAQLIINVIVLLAIAGLYILYFTGKPGHDAETDMQGSQTTASGMPDAAIAYVNIDTLLNNYDLFYEMRTQLEQKFKQSQAELDRKTKSFEEAYKDLQYKAQRGLETRSKLAEMEQDLMQEQNEILQLRERLTVQLAEEEQVMNRKLINEIMEFLEDYNKANQYQYVLSRTFGSNVLYANDSLNITSEVLNGLNERHQSSLNKEE